MRDHRDIKQRILSDGRYPAKRKRKPRDNAHGRELYEAGYHARATVQEML